MVRRLLIVSAACLVLVSACDPRPCPGTCDPLEVGARIAGDSATNCGRALFGTDASPVQSCMATEFAAGRPFFGVVEQAGPSGATLLRGFIRNNGGQLREFVGSHIGPRTLVDTRFCLAAMVMGATLVCTNEMDGLHVECDCAGSSDAGQGADL